MPIYVTPDYFNETIEGRNVNNIRNQWEIFVSNKDRLESVKDSDYAILLLCYVLSQKHDISQNKERR